VIIDGASFKIVGLPYVSPGNFKLKKLNIENTMKCIPALKNKLQYLEMGTAEATETGNRTANMRNPESISDVIKEQMLALHENDLTNSDEAPRLRNFKRTNSNYGCSC